MHTHIIVENYIHKNMESYCPVENNNATEKDSIADDNLTKVLPFPPHLKKQKYGLNKYLLLLSFINPYHLIGAGLFVSLFLPTFITVILSLAFVIYPVVRQILRYYDYLPVPYTEYILHPPHSARCDGDFVVFLIGIRPNGANPLTKTFSEVGKAFQSMIAELESDPSFGYMGGDAYIGMNERKSTTMMVQYWRSYEALQKWTHTRMGIHMKTMLEYGKKDRFEGINGIWHETYKVRDGEYESIYAHMPPIGLALATQAVEDAKLNNGPGRMKRREREKQAQAAKESSKDA